MPLQIRVDNGRPFGDPKMDLAPPLALWLIGLGIKVIWNPPARPQKNAKVERSQGVMGRWTEYGKCKDTDDLQERLWREAEFHNCYFPIRRLGGKTRMQTYPGLLYSGREWNPSVFKLNRCLVFLAKGRWERKVSTNGQINHYGKRLSVGIAYKHQIVSIKLDARKNQWNVFSSKGDLIKTEPTSFSSQSVWVLDFS